MEQYKCVELQYVYMRTRDLSRFEWIRQSAIEPILDVGSAHSPYFDSSVLYTGVDINPDSTDIQGDIPESFIQADGAKLPVKDNSFKTVLLAEVLEHMDNPVSGLAEAKRVASNKVITTVPDESRWDSEAQPGENENHKRQYTGKMLFDQYLKAGFGEENIKIDYLNEGPFAFWLGTCEYDSNTTHNKKEVE